MNLTALISASCPSKPILLWRGGREGIDLLLLGGGSTVGGTAGRALGEGSWHPVPLGVVCAGGGGKKGEDN